MYIIYRVTNIVNNKIYIGQTSISLNERKSQHMQLVRKKHKNKFHNAVNKYGDSNFKWEVIEDILDSSNINDRERYWILYYKSFLNGYNSTTGGEKNFKHSEISRKKLSIALTGNKNSLGHICSEETRKKISIKNKGKIIPQYQRDAVAKAHLGKPAPFRGHKHTEEAKQLIREKRKLQIIPKEAYTRAGESRSKQVIRLPDNKVYDSLKSAAKDIGVDPSNISHICSGHKQRCKGYSFKKFINKEKTNV